LSVDLILWRHADAKEGGPDLERRLTRKGERQAARMAEWLRRHLPSEFMVIASPARRAQETAAALGKRVKTSERLAPGASAADILQVAGWPDRKRVVIIVGHQPDLGHAASQLLAGAAAPWSVRKGGLWWLSDRVRGDDAQVVVRAVLSPDFL
jgi:phosphohistidine phosphatase